MMLVDEEDDEVLTVTSPSPCRPEPVKRGREEGEALRPRPAAAHVSPVAFTKKGGNGLDKMAALAFGCSRMPAPVKDVPAQVPLASPVDAARSDAPSCSTVSAAATSPYDRSLQHAFPSATPPLARIEEVRDVAAANDASTAIETPSTVTVAITAAEKLDVPPLPVAQPATTDKVPPEKKRLQQSTLTAFFIKKK